MNTHGLIVGLAVASVLVQDGQEAKSHQTQKEPQLVAGTEPEYLLLDLLYDGIRVDTSFAALTDYKGRRFLALRPMSVALGCRLQVNASKKTVAGFLSNPSDRVELNAAAHMCRRGNKKIKFESWQCFERDGDLYIEEGLLAEWAGFHFLWRMNRLELEVTADRSLPVRRQLTQIRLLDQQSEAKPNSDALTFVQSPYELFTRPAIDAQLYSSTASGPRATPSDSRLVVQGVGDALFMGAKYRFYSRTKRDHAAMLLTFGREDAHGRLLGPLQATQLSVGDISVPSVALLDRAGNGVGISISNFPLAGMDGAGDSTLEGKAEPSSLVELYRENDLVKTVRADAQGVFRFTDLQLETGPNVLRVVVTTPSGDVQEERRILYGDVSGPKVGMTRYRLTAAQIGGSVLNTPLTDEGESRKRQQFMAEYQLGLTTASWLSALLVQVGHETDLGLGIHSWSGRTLMRAQATASPSGQASASAGISRKVGSTNVSIEHTRSLGGQQLRIGPELGTDAMSATKLRIDGIGGLRRSEISWGLGVDRLEGSNASTLIRGRVSGSSKGYFVSNSVALRYSDSPFDGAGLLQLRKQFGDLTGRFDVRYNLSGGSMLDSLHASADRRISSDYRARLGVDFDRTREANFDLIGSIYRMFGPMAVGLSATMDSAGSLKANLLLSVGFSGDAPLDKVNMSKAGTGQSGCVQVRAFLDRNLSGAYDAGDLLLPDIGVRINGHLNRAKTGSKGVCVIDRLAPSQAVSIELNEDTFIDPTWIGNSAAVNVLPRAGRTVKLDFAVVESGEIEGKAVGIEHLTGGLIAELVAKDDKVSQTSVLDADGSYVFSQIRPGQYRLRIMDADGRKLTERPINIGMGTLVRHFDLSLP